MRRGFWKLCFYLSVVATWTILVYRKLCVSEYGEYQDYLGQYKEREPVKQDAPRNTYLDYTQEMVSEDDLEVLVHVSDIHISKFKPNINKNFDIFLDEVVPSIDPLLVLCTGDLVDGKIKSSLNSGQILSEWEHYHDAITKRGYNNASFWIDLPGNHDTFNVDRRMKLRDCKECLDLISPDRNKEIVGYKNDTRNNIDSFSEDCEYSQNDVFPSNMDLFSLFGVQKERNIVKIVESKVGRLGIVSIDATQNPGPKKPFNFFGYVTREEMDMFEENLEKCKDICGLHKIVLSHYPISTILFSRSSSGKGFCEMSYEFSMFACGHLHDLFLGIGDDLVYRYESGFLDMEVSSLGYNSVFRIISIYKDEFMSFSDHKIDEFCFVHIISPKNSKFNINEHEKNWLPYKNFVVFSIYLKPGFDEEDMVVDAYVNDNIVEGVYRENIKGLVGSGKGFLYNLPYNMDNLIEGVNEVRIRATLVSKKSPQYLENNVGQSFVESSHKFTKDRSDMDNMNFGKYLFMKNRFYHMFLYIIALSYLVVVFLILVSRLTSNPIKKPFALSTFIDSIYHVGRRREFYRGYLLLLFYLPIFPLFCGKLTERDNILFNFQIVYLFGIYDFITADFNPGLDPLGMVSFHIVFSFVLPSIVLFICKTFLKRVGYRKSTSIVSILFFLGFDGFVAFWWFLSGINFLSTLAFYRCLAVVFSPIPLWFYIYALYLYYMVF